MAGVQELQAEVFRLESLISRCGDAWLELDPGIPWEGGIADAMYAAVREIICLRRLLAGGAVDTPQQS